MSTEAMPDYTAVASVEGAEDIASSQSRLCSQKESSADRGYHRCCFLFLAILALLAVCISAVVVLAPSDGNFGLLLRSFRHHEDIPDNKRHHNAIQDQSSNDSALIGYGEEGHQVEVEKKAGVVLPHDEDAELSSSASTVLNEMKHSDKITEHDEDTMFGGKTSVEPEQPLLSTEADQEEYASIVISGESSVQLPKGEGPSDQSSKNDPHLTVLPEQKGKSGHPHHDGEKKKDLFFGEGKHHRGDIPAKQVAHNRGSNNNKRTHKVEHHHGIHHAPN